MLVGNKADLRDTAAAEGQKCVPGYFGEKLAMVSVRMVQTGIDLQNSRALESVALTSVYFCFKRFFDRPPPPLMGLPSYSGRSTSGPDFHGYKYCTKA